ncbi:CC0125/CC1285 family lipoprotein [Parasphingorhabdus sp.]|uniref:CC0125/CC1285 family lipoprotein n=1 Tax=Parasphingorhabdus sp. TaxID=2709688 RepID=UPI003C746E22
MMDRKIFYKPVSTATGLLATLLLFACATATPYQPELPGQRISGGYSETRLGDKRYRVHFAGNTLTSRETVEGYLLYRAAELTVQSGYDWFRITDHTTETDRRTYVDRVPRYEPWYGSSYVNWRPHWRYYRSGVWSTWHPYGRDPFWSYDTDVRTVERFEAEAEIVMRRGTMRADESRAFDARKVLEDLEPSIKRPEDG